GQHAVVAYARMAGAPITDPQPSSASLPATRDEIAGAGGAGGAGGTGGAGAPGRAGAAKRARGRGRS
ncbi:MAG: hypothetical protein WBQ18_01875, partial [Solirubrobacteraceae bacterium]